MAEFQPDKTFELLEKIKSYTSDRPMTLMEVCGTHTHAIFATGARSLMPPNLKIISGPGCPVCVTSQEDIDKMIALSEIPNLAICTFGDMLKVPGTNSSLALSKSKGVDVRIMYSPFDVIGWSQKETNKTFVLVGIGFETTTPGFAATIIEAKKRGIKNILHLCLHKTVPNALEALAQSTEVKVDGLILPGHVSAIIGVKPYQFLADKYKIPGVVMGFEGEDIISGVEMLTKMISSGKPEIKNQYTRVVKDDGNAKARELVATVFEDCGASWRGLGIIPMSGLKHREKYEDFDVLKHFNIDVGFSKEADGCICGKVIIGAMTPNQCPLFERVCTPSNPVGPCMVSGEGTCSAYFKYNRKRQ
ncbi:MAG: hydrogenase formation protein HypD [Caldiserica bacterium]|nr:hydrogenase formation protein HypD [Caldisericota bacterium]